MLENRKKWLMMIPTMLAAFMFAIDETIANIALPHIAGSFSISTQESIWILTSYLIASCLTIPMIDWLTKLLGRRCLFISMVLLFTISSFSCGISTSMLSMIISRFFQGLGGGVLIPIAQANIIENFKGKDLALATTIFGMVVILAPILGPILGGWITDNWSWNWIFFINIPICVIILLISKKFIIDPPYAKKQKNVKTDYWGLIFLITFAVSFQIMLDKGNDLDWFGSPFIRWLTVFWVVSLISFIISQITQKDSLVKFNVFKNWNFALGTIILTIMNGILLGSMAIVPQFMQTMMGYDAFTSGVAMMPRGLGCFIGCIISGKLQTIIDIRIISFIGVIILSLGSYLLGFVNLEISSTSIAIPNIMYGLGMALGFIPFVTLSCSTIPPEQMSNASGLQNFLKTIGAAIGTSLVATSISRFSQVHQNMMVKNLSETNPIYIERIQFYTAQFLKNTDVSTATYMAKLLLYKQMLMQSRLWGYIQSFRLFAIAGIIVLLLLFFMKDDRKLRENK